MHRFARLLGSATPGMLLVLGVPACTPVRDSEPEKRIVRGHLDPEPDLSTPIGQKWFKLGGQDVVGAAISEVTPLTGHNASYQEFQHGVITFSDVFGALFMPKEIFTRWRTGSALLILGLPKEDSVQGQTFVGNQVVTHTRVRFESGVIVRDASNAAYVIEQDAAKEYLGGCGPGESTCGWQKLGNPLEEAQLTQAPPLRAQRFTGGTIYYGSSNAVALWGPILTRYADNSMPPEESPFVLLGKPESSPKDVVNTLGTVIGQVASFEKGSIFFSPSTGAHIVSDVLEDKYLNTYGGPAGWLGFPIGDTGGAKGEEFNDFEHGMLINHPHDDGFKGINALGTLSFHMASATIWDEDGGDSDNTNETYVKYEVSTSAGLNISSALCQDGGEVLCEDGDVSDAWDQTITPNKLIPLGVANSQLNLSLKLSLWDYDDLANGADEHYGTWSHTYNRHTLFGLAEYGIHNVEEASATYGIQSTHAYDASDFMGTQWWSFDNWSTEDVTYNQFAQAFADVGPDESKFWHPFNHIWYEAFVRSIADKGNCAGMAIESIYAQRGASAFPEPIYQYFPNTQDGTELGAVIESSDAHKALANEINVRHAYQAGSDMVQYYLRTLTTGGTHSPVDAFYEVKESLDAGSPMMIGLSTFWWGKAHVVRAYATALSQPCTQGGTSPCDRILVADPNLPKVLAKSPKFIEIDAGGHFYYKGAKYDYDGDTFLGDRMYPIPFEGLLDHEATTPFGVFAAVDLALFMAGSDGSVDQVTNETGQTFFKPGLAAPPSSWDDINTGPTAISDMAPIPLLDSEGAQLLAVKGHGTYTYEVDAAAGAPPGKPFDLLFISDYMSAVAKIPGTPGKPDQFTAHGINTPSKAVSVALHPTGVSKPIQLTVGAPERHRWAELSNLALSPGQRMSARLGNGGSTLTLENQGPATTANLRVSPGPGATPVVLGTIEIPGGVSSVELQAPRTTLTVTGQVPGNDGWLLAPVTLALSATDASGLGIDRIEHRRDALSWETYACPPGTGSCSTGPFAYTHEGETLFSYRAIDRARNIEAAKQSAFKIDTLKPVVTASTDQPSYTRLQVFVVHGGATDPAPGSGLKSVSMTLDSAPVSDGQSIDLLWFSLGSHTVSVQAEDVAGWQAGASAGFELIATPESVKALIQKLRALGEIDSDGVATSFLQKAERAHWNALLNELRAQTGKHISQKAAGILEGDVLYVMTH